jgi:hypothetical protein
MPSDEERRALRWALREIRNRRFSPRLLKALKEALKEDVRRRLANDDARRAEWLAAIEQDEPASVCEKMLRAMLEGGPRP